MYLYLKTLPQWLQNSVIITCLSLLILIIAGSGFLLYKIIKRIKQIKLEAAGAEIDIQIETPTSTIEIKQSEGAEK